ncbi:MAG: hypothetical protein Q8L30_02080 [bacterium]|nr:hypothetical protein [bacterium]
MFCQKPKGEVLMKKEKAIKEDRAVWPDYAVSVRFSNRDEKKDEVEASDHRATGYRETALEPTTCLGFACPASSDVCDVCNLNPSLVPPKKRSVRPRQSEDGLASIVEAKLYVQLAAPTSRGRRVGEILRLSDRFGF